MDGSESGIAMSEEADWLAELEDWYAKNCNGDWEHQFGVRIETIDNPGWRVSGDIEDTVAQGRILERVAEETDCGWMQYWSDGVRLQAACSPRCLSSTIKVLMIQLARWAD